MLKLGAVFPMEFGSDPALIRDFVQTIEGLGYDYILTYEQLVNTNPGGTPATWLEPFVLLSYIAALTDKLELATGISVLSSRQTVLAAKQIADLDRLCGGRLRLGVSAGWNKAEYQAAGIDFASRGKRLDEQIPLLRQLWTQDYVTFAGTYHTLENVGLFPKPKQQPIPIWIGGYADAALKRAATLGDGWLADAANETPQSIAPKLDTLKGYAQAAGRNPDAIGLEVVDVHLETERDWGAWIQDWEAIGAGYMSVTSRHAKFSKPQQHLDLFTKFVQVEMAVKRA
jgi:probable F420-dependent oxidoreductase